MNAIVNLARRTHNARRNQGQARLMQIQNNLNMLKMEYGNNAVNKVYRLALHHIRKMSLNHRVNQRVKNAAHKFKVGPRVTAARPVLNYLPPNAVNKIVTEIRKRKRNNG